MDKTPKKDIKPINVTTELHTRIKTYAAKKQTSMINLLDMLMKKAEREENRK